MDLDTNGRYHYTAITAAVVIPYGIKVDYDVRKPFGNNINSYRSYSRAYRWNSWILKYKHTLYLHQQHCSLYRRRFIIIIRDALNNKIITRFKPYLLYVVFFENSFLLGGEADNILLLYLSVILLFGRNLLNFIIIRTLQHACSLSSIDNKSNKTKKNVNSSRSKKK